MGIQFPPIAFLYLRYVSFFLSFFLSFVRSFVLSFFLFLMYYIIAQLVKSIIKLKLKLPCCRLQDNGTFKCARRRCNTRPKQSISSCAHIP